MRKSGIFLHITSLPSQFGVGSVGYEADNFIKFLVKAKQKVWQILPANIVDGVNSPYSSPCGFAGNFLLIDPMMLYKEELLTDEDINKAEKGVGNDYNRARKVKAQLLRIAYYNFFAKGSLTKFYQFCDQNEYWLNDYCVFMTAKDLFDGKPWYEWEPKLKNRDVNALKDFAEKYDEQIDFYKFEQFIFFSQWQDFRERLKKNNILLFGDLPFYVNYDSVEVWKDRNLFSLKPNGELKFVGGCPPDALDKVGQYWSMPTYNFKAMQKDNFKWWIDRVKYCEKLYDILRIDHFRAFESYFEIKAGKLAKSGKMRKGVGAKLLELIQHSVSDTFTLVAEDLGANMDKVYQLREKCNICGMKVMEYAFDGSNHIFLPKNYEVNCIGYLSTHDTDTAAGWYDSLPIVFRKIVTDYVYVPSNTKTNEVIWRLLEELSNSNADTIIISMPDLNALGSSARMNYPGRLDSWTYMATDGEFSTSVAKKLAQLTVNAKRD